jgi:glc operon protein GlcG
MRQKVSLTASETDVMAATVRLKAKENGWNIAVAIVDDGGFLLRLDRMDGAGPMSPDIALGKARMAALTRHPSKFWEERVASRPGFLNFPFGLPIQGALPIVHAGECIGAIGVSGVASVEDEQLAAAGIEAIRAVLTNDHASVSGS